MKKSWLSDICLPVYILILIFNLASWIDLSTMWVELPLMVNRLPEGWRLPSYFIVIIQGSKLALITWAILKHFLKDKLKDWPAVYAIIGIGAACLFIAGFVWDKTVVIGEQEVSLPILTITAILSTVDSMSTVTFLPYMSRYRPQYITAFFVGEGVCHVMPAILSMIQGVGESPECRNQTVYFYNESTGLNHTYYQVEAVFPDPKFSVRAFFIFMSCVMLSSGVAFTLLHFHPYFKKEQVHLGSPSDDPPQEKPTTDSDLKVDAILLQERNSNKENNFAEDIKEPDGSATDGMLNKHADPKTEEQKDKLSKKKMTKTDFVYCVVMLLFSFGLMYGLMPGIQPYSFLPYGNRAYHLAVRLGLAMNPIVSFLALFVSTRSKVVLNILYAFGTCMLAYQVVLASLSPFPPLKGTVIGETIVVSSTNVYVHTHCEIICIFLI